MGLHLTFNPMTGYLLLLFIVIIITIIVKLTWKGRGKVDGVSALDSFRESLEQVACLN